MSWRLRIQPRARLEIIDATEWYAQQGNTFADKFTAALDNTLTRIQENPFQYQLVHLDIRRALLHRFPYMVIYGIAEAQVIVLGCVHGNIDPRRWKGRS
jgi:plasmid stabilization system protein ParE